MNNDVRVKKASELPPIEEWGLSEDVLGLLRRMEDSSTLIKERGWTIGTVLLELFRSWEFMFGEIDMESIEKALGDSLYSGDVFGDKEYKDFCNLVSKSAKEIREVIEGEGYMLGGKAFRFFYWFFNFVSDDEANEEFWKSNNWIDATGVLNFGMYESFTVDYHGRKERLLQFLRKRLTESQFSILKTMIENWEIVGGSSYFNTTINKGVVGNYNGFALTAAEYNALIAAKENVTRHFIDDVLRILYT